jgi:hypothetical protein
MYVVCSTYVSSMCLVSNWYIISRFLVYEFSLDYTQSRILVSTSYVASISRVCC